MWHVQQRPLSRGYHRIQIHHRFQHVNSQLLDRDDGNTNRKFGHPSQLDIREKITVQ